MENQGVHKDISTLEVGTESRLRPSSQEAETRKQALSENPTELLPGNFLQPRLQMEACEASVFKCLVFIGRGFMSLVFLSPGLNQCLPPLLIYYPQISHYFNEWLTEIKKKSRISCEHSWSFHSVPWPRSESIRWPSVYQMAESRLRMTGLQGASTYAWESLLFGNHHPIQPTQEHSSAVCLQCTHNEQERWSPVSVSSQGGTAQGRA